MFLIIENNTAVDERKTSLKCVPVMSLNIRVQYWSDFSLIAGLCAGLARLYLAAFNQIKTLAGSGPITPTDIN